MSNKKYLDYEGLQYYDSKWLLKFNEMIMADDDLDLLFNEAVNGPTEWTFTIDTEATSRNEKKTGIPFHLYNQDATLYVDWGDGNSSKLTASDYTEKNTSASVHEYASVGEYTITVKCSNWNNLYIFTSSEQYLNTTQQKNIALYWWRRTLTSVDNAVPLVKGTNRHGGTSSTWSTLFQHPTTDFSYLFESCTKLTSIPQDLFESNPDVTEFERCFMGCSALTSIPESIFDNRTVTECNFEGCFTDCTSLSSIPSNLFYGIESGYFNDCFNGCTSLQSIPSNLFDGINGSSFSACFGSCTSITSIPAGLFDSSIDATAFDSCFYGCTSLASIPANIFKFNTKVEDFSSCFQYCSSLQSLPANLFNSTYATYFNSVFYGCTLLASIPGDLFTVAGANGKYFEYAFQECSALASIPSTLFSANYAADDMTECFSACISITSIPSNLFPAMVKNFSGCFADCTSLASIPTNLFSNNNVLENLEACFDGCSSLGDFTLYIDSSYVDYAYNFVSYKSNATRTIYVPENSTTAYTFNDYAEDLGLTIVEQ